MACDQALVERVVGSLMERKASLKDTSRRHDAASLEPLVKNHELQRIEPVVSMDSQMAGANPPFLRPSRSPALLHSDGEMGQTPLTSHTENASEPASPSPLNGKVRANIKSRSSRLRSGSVRLQINARRAAGSFESGETPRDGLDGRPPSAGQGLDDYPEEEGSPGCVTADVRDGSTDRETGMVDVIGLHLGRFR